MKEEEDVGPEAPTVNLQKFEYDDVGQTQRRREKRKLQLVRKETLPGAMYNTYKIFIPPVSSNLVK